MTVIDYIILSILLISTGISFLRGFVREAFSLVSWIVALGLAYFYTDRMALFLIDSITIPVLRNVVSFLLLFFATLIVASMVTYIMGQLVKRSGLGGTDRMIGMVFGIARGAIVVSVIVLVASATDFPKELWWQESKLVGHFQQLALMLKERIPDNLGTSFAAN